VPRTEQMTDVGPGSVRSKACLVMVLRRLVHGCSGGILWISRSSGGTVCGGSDSRPHKTNSGVRLLSGPPPKQLTEILGVLRRRATYTDRLPQAALSRLGFSEVWADGIRRAGTVTRWDLQFYLVPGVMQDYNHACTYGSREARSHLGVPLVSLDIYESAGRVGAVAYTVGDIDAGLAVRSYPGRDMLGTQKEQVIIAGVVPDDVAYVEVGAAGNQAGTRAQVKDNFFEAETAIGKHPTEKVSTLPWSMTWYDVNGDILETITKTMQRMSFHVSAEIPEK
jgi:hypothetical protein